MEQLRITRDEEQPDGKLLSSLLLQPMDIAIQEHTSSSVSSPSLTIAPLPPPTSKSSLKLLVSIDPVLVTVSYSDILCLLHFAESVPALPVSPPSASSTALLPPPPLPSSLPTTPSHHAQHESIRLLCKKLQARDLPPRLHFPLISRR